MPYTVRRVIYSLPLHKPEVTSKLEKIVDIEKITSEFLIRHIDNRMKCREQVTWLSNLDFGEFCEYLLPYRLTNEPMIGWQDSTQTLWKEVLQEMTYYDELPQTLENAMSFQRNLTGNRDDDYVSGLKTPEGIYNFDCIDRSYYDIHCFRASGVASAVDFIPHWPTRNGNHYWKVIIDPDLKFSNLSETRNPVSAKVYRITYSHNEIPRPEHPDETVPDFFQHPFYRDVSSDYMNVGDIELPVSFSKDYSPEYIYLCVFSNFEWQPVAWSKVRKGKAVFSGYGI